MFKFTLRRFLSTLPVVLIAITFCFFTLRLAPGGPFDEERPLPPIVKENLEKHYGLDKPLIVQYGQYLLALSRGDLGPSFTDLTYNVNEKIANGLPYTIKLGGLALLVAIFLGIGSGVVSAIHKNSNIDRVVGFIVLFGLVVPNFLLAPLLQEFLGKRFDAWLSDLFDTKVDLLAIGGWGEGGWKNLTLPVLILAFPHISRISRLVRGAMSEVLASDFIRTARAKGLSESAIVLGHALRPSITPAVSYLGPAAGYLLTGSLVVEFIFGLPGIGRYFIVAALNRDYGMVLGTVVFYMFLIIVLNLIVDFLYALLDPRVRYR